MDSRKIAFIERAKQQHKQAVSREVDAQVRKFMLGHNVENYAHALAAAETRYSGHSLSGASGA